MITYEIKNGDVNFTQDFKMIECTFEYKENGKTFYGGFICDVEWSKYFIDPVLCRFLQLGSGENWLSAVDLSKPLNDIFYNKLIEYMALHKNEDGTTAIEIENKRILGDDRDVDNLYTETEEIALFNTIFNDITFIEEFKNVLNNPAKYNLTSALLKFKKDSNVNESKYSVIIKSLIG